MAPGKAPSIGYKCRFEGCDKTVKRIYDLPRHEALHRSDTRMYQCRYCHYKNSQKGNRNAHEVKKHVNQVSARGHTQNVGTAHPVDTAPIQFVWKYAKSKVDNNAHEDQVSQNNEADATGHGVSAENFAPTVNENQDLPNPLISEEEVDITAPQAMNWDVIPQENPTPSFQNGRDDLNAYRNHHLPFTGTSKSLDSQHRLRKRHVVGRNTNPFGAIAPEAPASAQDILDEQAAYRALVLALPRPSPTPGISTDSENAPNYHSAHHGPIPLTATLEYPHNALHEQVNVNAPSALSCTSSSSVYSEHMPNEQNTHRNLPYISQDSFCQGMQGEDVAYSVASPSQRTLCEQVAYDDPLSFSHNALDQHIAYLNSPVISGPSSSQGTYEEIVNCNVLAYDDAFSFLAAGSELSQNLLDQHIAYLNSPCISGTSSSQGMQENEVNYDDFDTPSQKAKGKQIAYEEIPLSFSGDGPPTSQNTLIDEQFTYFFSLYSQDIPNEHNGQATYDDQSLIAGSLSSASVYSGNAPGHEVEYNDMTSVPGPSNVISREIQSEQDTFNNPYSFTGPSSVSADTFHYADYSYNHGDDNGSQHASSSSGTQWNYFNDGI